ncbi:MAG: glycosyltransferase [Clostridia bacterium]|nr:glycosyltransferase [Clostridia bacterium]
MNRTAAFVMPVKISGDDMELRFFRDSVNSIKNQTDKDWILVMVEDFSNDKRVYDAIDEIKSDLKDKLHVIYSDRNYGTGSARNKGVLYAKEIGAPFILFNDSDDISDPKRLELVRKAFEGDDSVNVVYTSFDVIDENDDFTPEEKIALPVREITDGHKVDIVEGENAWINIAIKKKYTNLTSCTAVKTSLACEELFPNASVSEDCHTWLRYAAHKGKFVFLREIKGKYRICSGTQSRSRSNNKDFYEKLFAMDSDGFEQAVKLAKKYGTMGGMDENDIRAGFYVRLALNLLNGGLKEYCKKSLEISLKISKEKTLGYIDKLPCDSAKKAEMKALIS